MAIIRYWAQARSPEIYQRFRLRAFLFTMGKFDTILSPDEICSMENNGMTDYGAMRSDANTFFPILAHPEAIKKCCRKCNPVGSTKLAARG